LTLRPEDIAPASWLSPKARLADILGKGRGLVATAPIAAGETVIRWGGDYRDAEGARRAEAEGRGVMQWDEALFSVETDDEDPACLLNHSCEGNLGMADAVTLVALRDIAAGEELTADYALWEADEDYVSDWECRCGTASCRGRIRGRDWRRRDVQERYTDFFSPLLSRRIASACAERASSLANRDAETRQ
jgi:hypothetical protein